MPNRICLYYSPSFPYSIVRESAPVLLPHASSLSRASSRVSSRALSLSLKRSVSPQFDVRRNVHNRRRRPFSECETLKKNDRATIERASWWQLDPLDKLVGRSLKGNFIPVDLQITQQSTNLNPVCVQVGLRCG